ncbi:MAG: HAD family hydrolase [Nanoarchaeota archaeon]|nr:HAD family hydrolase [Nanoarchaeota archaeon]
MEKIDFVVFDYNGTITDDGEIGRESCNRVLEELYGLPRITLEKFRDTFGTPWIDFYVLNGVRREDINIPTHQKIYQDAHTTLAKNGLRLRKYARETLQFLKQRGVKLGLLSSRNIEDLTNELRQVGIYELFDAVVGEDHIHEDGIKSEKKADKLIHLLGIADASKVLYVGDMIQDIDIAREQGFISGAITGGWQSSRRLEEKNPDYLFNSLNEIQSLFD